MRALSLWQPWASLVAMGVKEMETRSWPPPDDLVGERIAICATRSEPPAARVFFDDIAYLWCVSRGYRLFDDLPRGCVLATAQLSEPVRTEDALIGPIERACGDYSAGRWAWPLIDLAPCSVPIPVRGRQRLWELPADAMEALARD